jgi:betaine-aldehyde dehydrogenase
VGTQVLNNFVNGGYAAATTGQSSEVIDPSTGEPYAQAPVSGPADADAAVRAAAGAFEGHPPAGGPPGMP